MANKADNVTLRCLGDVPGPRFLRGLMRENHGVRLVTAQGGHRGDTVWRRVQSASGRTWTLQCLGAAPAGVDPGSLFLGGTSNGSVLIAVKAQMPDGVPEPWRARPVPGMDGAFTLENVALRDGGIAARFLDGRTQFGAVGLAPNTDPPFTGTRWEVVVQMGDHSHFIE